MQVVFPSVLLTCVSRASGLICVVLKIFISNIEILPLPAWPHNGLPWIWCSRVHITGLWEWIGCMSQFKLLLIAFATCHGLLPSPNHSFLFWQQAFYISIQDMKKVPARTPLQANTNIPEHHLPFPNTKSLLIPRPKVSSSNFQCLGFPIIMMIWLVCSQTELFSPPYRISTCIPFGWNTLYSYLYLLKFSSPIKVNRNTKCLAFLDLLE